MNKKKYVKPQILISSFELSESIAAGCEVISNAEENVCAVFLEELGDTIFSLDNVCGFTMPNGYDGICYHAPDDSRNIFTS